MTTSANQEGSTPWTSNLSLMQESDMLSCERFMSDSWKHKEKRQMANIENKIFTFIVCFYIIIFVSVLQSKRTKSNTNNNKKDNSMSLNLLKNIFL